MGSPAPQRYDEQAMPRPRPSGSLPRRSFQPDAATTLSTSKLPASSGTPEQFGLVLDKGSALTPCVSKAVDALRADGTLDQIVEQWLSQAGAPELS